MKPKLYYASSESVEHYTPRYIWERAILCMGAIDCDPAADIGKHIPAAVHFTKHQDGLSKRWTGRTWLNPPFGADIGNWFIHLEREYLAGRVTEAVVLWKAATETRAFRVLTRLSDTIAFPHKRIEFLPGSVRAGGKGSNFSPVLFYVGDNPARFASAYGDIADIWKLQRLNAIPLQRELVQS